jgi:type II secretory ATPase GspE/PulE/Tfp pilus assembly ATPase PilB-like protein
VSESQLVCRLPITESFSPEYLAYYRLLPHDLTEQSLRVAVAGEPHDEALEDLRTSYGVPLEVIAVTADELQAAIRQTFVAAESVVELVRDLSADLALDTDRVDEAATDVRDLANQPPVIRFANLLIREAQLLLDPPEKRAGSRSGRARRSRRGISVRTLLRSHRIATRPLPAPT